MPTLLTVIAVLLSFAGITTAQAQQPNACKQCREQQQACAKRLNTTYA